MNSEIDIRTPRTQRTLAAGARMLVASRTAVVVSARRFTLDFHDGALFRGVDLTRTLNSHTDSVDAGLQLLLSPLTTFSMTTSFQRDRFDAAPERDADTLRLVPAQPRASRLQRPAGTGRPRLHLDGTHEIRRRCQPRRAVLL